MGDYEVKPEEVTAALKSLRDSGFDLGGCAQVSQYVWDGQTPERRTAGLRRLKEADDMAEMEVRIKIADALRAAREVENDGT